MWKCRPTAQIHLTGQAEHEDGLRKAAKASSKAKAKPQDKAKIVKCRPTAQIHLTGHAEQEDGLRKAARASSKAEAKPHEKAKIEAALDQLRMSGIKDCLPPANFAGKCLI